MDRPLRIAHVCSTSEVSGANRYVFDCAAEQVRMGHEVVVCAPKDPGDAFSFADPNTPISAFGGVYAWSMNRAAARSKPDVIHCHGGKSARWLKYMPKRPPSVITIHSRYKPKTMSHLDSLIYIAEWQADMVQPFAGPKTHVPNWVPALNPSSREDAEAFRESIGVGTSECLIGFLGRMNFGKGADLLISAIRKLDEWGVRVAICGDGEAKEELINQAARDPRFVFHGTMDDPSPFYAACDLVVVPSRQEAFGLVALEAMASGTPVLVNDKEGLAEVARDYPDNRVNAEDTNALAEKIAMFIRRKSGDAILRQSYDISRFDRDKSVTSIIDVYRHIIAGAARSDR